MTETEEPKWTKWNPDPETGKYEGWVGDPGLKDDDKVQIAVACIKRVLFSPEVSEIFPRHVAESAWASLGALQGAYLRLKK